MMHIKPLLNSLRVSYLNVSSKWFNHKAQGPEIPREMWQPALFMIGVLGNWCIGVGAEFNTSTNKNEVVKVPMHLCCIHIYYSKDIWFDCLLAFFWVKWDGFRVLLKGFKSFVPSLNFPCTRWYAKHWRYRQVRLGLYPPGSHRLLGKEILKY